MAPGTGKPDDADDDKKLAGGFVPVATFMVDGRQIYRRADADEAVTDNIYMQAENVRPAASTPTTDATGTTPGTTAPGGTISTTAPSTQMAYVEYDVVDNLVDNVELSRVLQATGLPETVQHGGKTWKADEIQVYDPDVFDELKPAAQPMSGYTAFMGDEKDEVWLQADLDPTMLNTTAGTDSGMGNTAPPGSEGTAESTAETTISTKGPIFIKYDAQ